MIVIQIAFVSAITLLYGKMIFDAIWEMFYHLIASRKGKGLELLCYSKGTYVWVDNEWVIRYINKTEEEYVPTQIWVMDMSSMKLIEYRGKDMEIFFSKDGEKFQRNLTLHFHSLIKRQDAKGEEERRVREAEIAKTNQIEADKVAAAHLFSHKLNSIRDRQ